jgi:catechol 2,3-dioxygenase-like lactoylglutathione lyase family enzyme
MITGVHAIIYSPEADAARAFLRDVAGFRSIDNGGGWLIFALPPAELAVHPSDGAAGHELFFLCDDIQATIQDLREKGADIDQDVSPADNTYDVCSFRLDRPFDVRLPFRPRDPAQS